MKKVSSSLLAILSLAAVVSCSKDAAGDRYETVTFNVAAETMAATKAIGTATDGVSDGKTATHLLYWTLDRNGKKVASLSGDATLVDRQATVTLRLLKGQKYSFLFVAEAPGQDLYTVNDNTWVIDVDYARLASNTESQDLFYATDEIAAVTTADASRTVILRRPLAQINLGTVEGDIAAAENALVTRNTITTAIEFTTQLDSRLDVFTGLTSEPKTVSASLPTAYLVDQTLAKKLRVDVGAGETAYDYVQYVYVLAAPATTTVDLKYHVNASMSQGTFSENVITVTNVPIQRNYRSNILGSIFTVGADFTIIVNPNYTADMPGVPAID